MESRGKRWEGGGFAFIFFFCCLREQTDRRKEKKKVEKKKKNGLAGDIEFREWIKTDDERKRRESKKVGNWEDQERPPPLSSQCLSLLRRRKLHTSRTYIPFPSIEIEKWETDGGSLGRKLGNC